MDGRFLAFEHRGQAWACWAMFLWRSEVIMMLIGMINHEVAVNSIPQQGHSNWFKCLVITYRGVSAIIIVSLIAVFFTSYTKMRAAVFRPELQK